MVLGSFTFAEWFVLVQHELLLFAAAFFALGMIDEFAIDSKAYPLRLGPGCMSHSLQYTMVLRNIIRFIANETTR